MAGALVVANSSMTSLNVFAHLVSISDDGLTTIREDGKAYSVVITGLLRWIQG